MTRYYAEEPCEHGKSKPGECDHVPTDRRAGGCIRLDCNVLHAVPCPGGSRRRVRIDYEAAHLKADEIGVRAIRPSIEYIVDAALITEEGT